MIWAVTRSEVIRQIRERGGEATLAEIVVGDAPRAVVEAVVAALVLERTLVRVGIWGEARRETYRVA